MHSDKKTAMEALKKFQQNPRVIHIRLVTHADCCPVCRKTDCPERTLAPAPHCKAGHQQETKSQVRHSRLGRRPETPDKHSNTSWNREQCDICRKIER